MSPSSSISIRLRSMCLVSVWLLGALACKTPEPTDAGDDGDQPATPIESDDAAQVLAEQICEQAFGCGCTATGYADEAACVDGMTAQISATIDATLSAGGSWDPECAGDLAKAMRDWECLGPTLASLEATFNMRLCPVLKGSYPVNTACYQTQLGDECEAGLMCIQGVCQQPPSLPVPIGQPCYYNDLPCESGSWCTWNADYTMQICQALPSEGDGCPPDSLLCGPASQDLICDTNSMTCIGSPGEGETCDSGLCAPGLYCDGGKGMTCQPRQELGEGCGADAVCPVDAQCLMNFCQARPALVCDAGNIFF